MDREKVIYDERIPKIKEQRKRRANRRFILLIVLFFMLFIIILYTQSPLSKLSQVEWEGEHISTTDELMDVAGLEQGISYFNISANEIESALEEQPQIERAEVSRAFPNRLKIQLDEYEVVAFWAEEQAIHPVLANGQILLERDWEDTRVIHPLLTAWPHREGVVELSKELAQLPSAVTRQISEITLVPQVADPYRLHIYMMDGYEVRTSITQFAENMNWYPQLARQAKTEGLEEGIFYLLDGKWMEIPDEG